MLEKKCKWYVELEFLVASFFNDLFQEIKHFYYHIRGYPHRKVQTKELESFSYYEKVAYLCKKKL